MSCDLIKIQKTWTLVFTELSVGVEQVQITMPRDFKIQVFHDACRSLAVRHSEVYRKLRRKGTRTKVNI